MESLNIPAAVQNRNNLTFNSGTIVKCQHLLWKCNIIIKLTPLASLKDGVVLTLHWDLLGQSHIGFSGFELKRATVQTWSRTAPGPALGRYIKRMESPPLQPARSEIAISRSLDCSSP